MDIEHAVADTPGAPFPIHSDLTARLLDASPAARDPALAHALAVLAGYAYADLPTMAMMAGRIGLGGARCVRVAQVVDAMYVFSTAYVVQSACGRVAVLVYRGTELANIGNWLADVDVGVEQLVLDGKPLRVHAGFRRNLRATRAGVLDQLERALAGPLEALYVTGHSLGGAMAALFGLTLPVGSDLAERLRAVYTYGQPLVVDGEPPASVGVAGRVIRHVRARDPVPGLPLGSWGRLAHFGVEYRNGDDGWTAASTPTAQLPGLWRARRALSLFEHGPHRYIADLAPAGSVSEFGD